MEEQPSANESCKHPH